MSNLNGGFPSTQNEESFILSITHNAPSKYPQSRHVCMKGRRCYRLADCDKCFDSYSDFLIQQVRAFVPIYKMDHFITITLDKRCESWEEAYRFGAKIRRLIFKRIFRGLDKYVAVLNVDPFKLKPDCFHPHLHILTTEKIGANEIKKAFNALPLIERQHRTCIKSVYKQSGLICYFLKKNFRKRLKLRPKMLRPLTCSLPFIVGRANRENYLKYNFRVNLIIQEVCHGNT